MSLLLIPPTVRPYMGGVDALAPPVVVGNRIDALAVLTPLFLSVSCMHALRLPCRLRGVTTDRHRCLQGLDR